MVYIWRGFSGVPAVDSAGMPAVYQSFTLHQEPKTPGFDPVNVTNQFERLRYGSFLAVSSPLNRTL